MLIVVLRVSIAMMRHHDHGKSDKGKHLIRASLQFQMYSPLLSWWEACWHAGRHGAEEGAEISTSSSHGQQEVN